MNKNNYLIAATFLAFAGTAQAEGIRPFVSLGLTAGGDDLLSIASSNGTDKIKAGGMLYAAGGVSFPFSNPNFEGRASLGYLFDSQNYENGDASFDRFPLEGLVMYRTNDKLFLGGGFAYHLSPSLSCDITSVCSGSVDFDDALGLTLQADWHIGEGSIQSTTVGLRYTDIEYEDSVGQIADGSHIGAMVTLQF